MKRSIILILILVSLMFAQAPTVTTEAATSITSTTATLNGTINPNGSSGKDVLLYRCEELIWVEPLIKKGTHFCIPYNLINF